MENKEKRELTPDEMKDISGGATYLDEDQAKYEKTAGALMSGFRQKRDKAWALETVRNCTAAQPYLDRLYKLVEQLWH